MIHDLPLMIHYEIRPPSAYTDTYICRITYGITSYLRLDGVEVHKHAIQHKQFYLYFIF
jgi:hypothetical protein